MIRYKYPYTNKCWWCGAKADSREHRYKRTDIVQEFGSGAYEGNDSVNRVIGEEPIKICKISRSKSKKVKFGTTLCTKCNGERSQPFDLAYEKFTCYVKKEEKRILAERKIYLNDIFGSSLQIDKLNLIKYFVKHIGCRLADAEIEVLPCFAEFLNGSGAIDCMSIELQIRGETLAFLEVMDKAKLVNSVGYLALGGIFCMYSQSMKTVDQIHSYFDYRWLRVDWHFNSDLMAKQHPFLFEDDVILFS